MTSALKHADRAEAEAKDAEIARLREAGNVLRDKLLGFVGAMAMFKRKTPAPSSNHANRPETGREHGVVSPQFHRNHRDLRGHRHGRLVALEPVGVHKGGHVLWRCRCDCGGEAIAQSNNLTRPAGTNSCGCLRREASKRRLKRDGAWNEGKSYAIGGGEHCYKTRRGWAKAALRQIGNKCQRCGWDEARCDVHHIVEKSKGGLHTLSNARVLCPNCHRVEHERGHQ